MDMKLLRSFLVKKCKIRGDTMEYTLEKLNKIMEDNDGDLDLSVTPITSLPEGLTIGGSLYLSKTPITSLPKGLKVGGWLDLRYTPIKSLPRDLTFGGSLCLSFTQIKSLPRGLKVLGNLDLSFTQITSLPEELSVGGSLYLNNTQITSLPKGLTFGGWLDLRNTKITSLPEGLKVGRDLYLSDTPISSLPGDLKVGGYLDLSNTPIKSLPEGLTVERDLYLGNTPIKSLPEGLTVGGSLYLKGTKIKSLPKGLKVGGTIFSDLPKNKVKYTKLQQGDYVENSYLFADGILTHIKAKKSFDKYTYFIEEFKGRNVLYDGIYYAHCKNIKQGIEDLTFKHATDRGSDQYKNLKLSSTLSFEESKTMYRVLTGACKQGTESFVNNLKTIKEQYTIQELLDLTVGQYGHEIFKKFFN